VGHAVLAALILLTEPILPTEMTLPTVSNLLQISWRACSSAFSPRVF